MPLQDYGVLAGRVVDHRAEGGADSPHFQIEVDGGGTRFRVAVNVMSAQSPPDLLYLADENFSHPILAQLPGLADGFTPLVSAPGGAALDFVRGNLFDRTAMRIMPADRPGPDNDLSDKLDHYVTRAAADPGARLYAFGQRWGPEPGVPDKIFGFRPGNGVHDIHMNQGNSGRFTTDDGVWQDGGLLFQFPDGAARWVAVFLAFQSQAWHTDDATGHTLPGVRPPDGGTGTSGDRRVRIVAALVNPVGPAPEAETATLLNTTPAVIDLTGWRLADRLGRSQPLSAVLGAGEAVRVPLVPPVQLGNSGGLLSLLDDRGLKVDGVAYTAADAGPEGRTLVF